MKAVMSPCRLSITGARVESYTVAPTLTFSLRADTDPSLPIHAIALRCQVRIDPRLRPYTQLEEDRLHELFGTRAQWQDSLRPLLWTQLSVLVPGFQTTTEFALTVPCTCDLEVAAGRYFQSLDEGDVPLIFLFSGSIFCSAGDRFQVVPVPWEVEAGYRLPITLWRDLMAGYFPEGAWLRLGRKHLDVLQAFRRRHALASTDAALEKLFEYAIQGERA